MGGVRPPDAPLSYMVREDVAFRDRWLNSAALSDYSESEVITEEKQRPALSVSLLIEGDRDEMQVQLQPAECVRCLWRKHTHRLRARDSLI